ncbi:MAG: ABC transporter transmembrane domain-containing protein, partial [Lachnospiraceae bacterium]|nr:ABC transporter transmembrane domain-containing protein [Lachnospiraceae bacterium]
MSSNKSKKPEHAFRVILRLLSYMISYKKRLIVVTICMILSAYSVAEGTALLIPAINDYIVPLIGKQEPDISGFLLILGKMTLFYVIGAVAAWLQGKIMVSVSNSTLFRIRSELFEVMEKMPLSYFHANSQGSVISLFSNDINAMNDMLRQGIPRIVNGIVTCVFIFVTMLYTNWRLAIVVLVCEFLLVIFLKTL